LAEVTTKAMAAVTADSTTKAMDNGTVEAKVDQQGDGCNDENDNGN
jgi:hypothetical protein